jgi:hypothetical protein
MINKKQQQALSVTIENNNNNKGIVTHAILCSLQGRETGEVAEEDVLVFLVPRQARKAETEVQHKCVFWHTFFGDGTFSDEQFLGHFGLHTATMRALEQGDAVL